MRVCAFVEPNRGATFDDQLRFAQHLEARGFAGFFRADHYQTVGDGPGLPGPTDAWLTLGAIARETSTIRLGTLMSPTTFRLPGPLAIAVAQVDQMSQGRVELGIGTGWYEREHRSYGIPFPSAGERVDRLVEQLDILTGLWSTPLGEHFQHYGRYYEVIGSPALPKPAQLPRPPIIVGGRGTRRTPEVAARYADEFNGAFQGVDETAQQYKRVIEAGERIGRAARGLPPIRFSIGIVAACGRTESEARHRAAGLYERTALPPEDPVIGTAEMLVDRIGQFEEVGATRVYLRIMDMMDLDHIDLIADRVLPALEP